MMEIRVAARVPQGPVSEPAVVFLDHRSERQAQRRRVAKRRKAGEVHGRDQLERIAAAANRKSWRLVERRSAHAGTVVIEAIRRPVERGREVELVVAGSAGGADEG